ncbi:hypothetical protein LUZ60_015131 [Juncus effusus]|nr:hypothetical protein LUZ60_015131 [Juncus effusus]
MANQATINGLNRKPQSIQPHFVLVPLMAQGHTIPMIDMAHLLANHGALVTFVTTPLNASRIKFIIQNAKDSQLNIRFVPLPFNCTVVGLPEGSENLDTLPNGLQQFKPFLEACFLLKDPLISYLQENDPPPNCVISDSTQAWTGEVARKFGIPRFHFIGFSAFASLCRDIIKHHKIYDNVEDENEPVPYPGFPHPLEVPKTRSTLSFSIQGLEEMREKMAEEDSKSKGAIVNTFQELESLYIDSYENFINRKVWPIGPLFLYNKDLKQMASRGNKAEIDEDVCLNWLDLKQNGSVLFVSFGSLVKSVTLQLIEIGLGLEASNKPFIWVIKTGEKTSEFGQWLLEQNFEERVRDRGLIIRGWAPQVMILSHKAIGGFVTHCGWNSTIEGICAGVPMVAWPQFGDQFFNEILIVDVLKLGVRIGVEKSVKWGFENVDEVTVKRDEVVRKILELMNGEGEGMERRNRARKLSEMAKMVMDEGGSSYEHIELLIQDIREKMLMKEDQIL